MGIFEWFGNVFARLGSWIMKPVTWAKSAIESYVGWVLGLYKQLIVWAVGLLIAAVTPILSDVLALLKQLIVWVIQQEWSIFNSSMSYLIAHAPTATQPSFTLVQHVCNAANKWLPIDLALTLGFSAVAFFGLVAGFLWIKRSVGGWI